MSYCSRGPDSDVYMYLTANYDKDHRRVVKKIVCHECALDQPSDDAPSDRYFQTISSALDHLLQHRAVGHRVPDGALARLRDGTG